MSRAIVLIGVSRTASPAFPTLEGVKDAIDKMEAWAKGQGISQIVKVTDVGECAVERVTIMLINDRIEALLAQANALQQLIIYFSGHGVVNSLNEYQLLSGAPNNANEAINVTASIAVAQTWKIPHVVFFSDACRTAAPTVQVSRITGGLIIPNEIVPGPEKLVDVFYATRLGTPALEVAANGKQYIAVYTDMLAKGLRGEVPALIHNGYIRPRPLKSWLAEAVPEHLIDLNLSVLTSQSPEARISSGDDEWLSEFDQPVHAAPPDEPDGFPSGGASMPDESVDLDGDAVGAGPDDFDSGSTSPLSPPPPPPLPPLSLPIRTPEAASILVEDALERYDPVGPAIRAEIMIQRTGRSLSPGAEDFLRNFGEQEQAPAWQHDDLHPSFRILGASVRDARCADGTVHVDQAATGCTLVVDAWSPGSEVLIEFDSGRGVLLPFLRDYVGVVQLKEGKLAEVHYEPVEPERAERVRSQLRLLRSAVYKASAMGSLNLDRKSASKLASRLQEAKFDDPSLAVYAAYAYQGTGQLGRIREMRQYLIDYRGIRLFDVDLLARMTSESSEAHLPPLLPSVPLLSQGWAFVDALRSTFPAELKPLREHVGQSLWSHYAPEGVAILKAWIDSRSAGNVAPTIEGDVV